MKNHSIYLLTLLSMILLSSCGKQLTYFTQNLYDEYNWSESELKQIQFYVSQDIELYRTAEGGNSSIEDGQIKVKSQRKVDQVIIKAGTPGILSFSPKDNRYAICFDDSGAYLIFGPGKKTRGRYTLRAKEWKERGQGGIVTYNGEEYYTSTENAYAALMVDLRKARKSVVKTKKASGVKVN